MSTTAPKTIRCAIYTRKSVAEGLDQEFNSLDAQRQAGEAYITSQAGAGWVCLPDRYDDGGFTGANVQRPAFKRLMADVASGGIDCIVLYKVDRLSRSLMDFARIMEILEHHGVSFVSVTQHFNTSQSMGRLTLNILLREEKGKKRGQATLFLRPYPIIRLGKEKVSGTFIPERLDDSAPLSVGVGIEASRHSASSAAHFLNGESDSPPPTIWPGHS